MNNLLFADGCKDVRRRRIARPSFFWPIFALFIALFAFMFLLYSAKARSKDYWNTYLYSNSALHFRRNYLYGSYRQVLRRQISKNDDYYSPYFKDAPMYISAVLLVAAITVLTFVLGKNDNFKFDSRSVAFGAICIAMSFALSYVRLFRLPQGGSVTLASLLPLMIFSYIFGVKKGFADRLNIRRIASNTRSVYNSSDSILLDYPIAYSAIGLGGAFAKFGVFKKCPQVALC